MRDGNLNLAIWKNESDKGFFLSADKIIRSYKNEADNWQETANLSGSQLLKAARLYQPAYEVDAQFRADQKHTDEELQGAR